MAQDIQRTLLRFGMRHGWRRDVPLLLGWGVMAILLGWPVLVGWLPAGVGGALLCLVTLYVLGRIYYRHSLSYTAATTAIVAVHTTDRRVRLEFYEERVRMETEYFRGEGAWTELEEIVMFPSFWALRFSSGGHIVIPAALVTPELRAFLHAKAEHVMAALLQP